jgi:hypothetical protein
MEARAEKATNKRWRVHTERWVDGGVKLAARAIEGSRLHFTAGEGPPAEQADADADFIASARSDLPRLIAEVRRLREALEKIAAGNPGTGDHWLWGSEMSRLARAALESSHE